MHLIQTLAAGVNGAENGTATITIRGTTTNATYYTAFDGGDGGTTGTLTLDSNGGAVVYVDQLVDVVVADSSGTTVRTFTEMVGSANVEVKSQSFTGTHYDTAASAASNPTTLLAVLDKWRDNAGNTADDIDWKVDVGGTATTVATVAASTEDFIFNVKAYGATGDGSTDDTTNIQTCLDAADTKSGAIVYFPRGTYRTTAALTVGRRISLMGANHEESVITYDAASNASILVFDESNTHSVFLSDMTITASQATTGSTLDFTANTDIVIERCNLGDGSSCQGYQIDCSSSSGRFVVRNSRIRAADTSKGCFFSSAGAADLYAFNTRFQATSGSFTGAVIENPGEVRLVACEISASSSSGAGVELVKPLGSVFCNIVGCHFKGSTNGDTKAIDVAGIGAGEFFAESGNTCDTNVQYLIGGALNTVTTASSSSSRFATSASQSATTYSLAGGTNSSVFLTQTGATLQVNVDTGSLPPPGSLVAIAVRASGTAVVLTFNTTGFESEYPSSGAGLTINDGNVATFLFMASDEGQIAQDYVQVGAYVEYTL